MPRIRIRHVVGALLTVVVTLALDSFRECQSHAMSEQFDV